MAEHPSLQQSLNIHIVDEEDEEEQSNNLLHALDFDFLNPSPFFHSYLDIRNPPSVYSDEDSVSDANSFFYADEDHLNFVTDLFGSRDHQLPDHVEVQGFGNQFEFNGFPRTEGLRVVGLESDSDSEDAELNFRDNIVPTGLDSTDFFDNLRFGNVNEEFDWEEINGGDNLSSVIERIEELSVSSEEGNSNPGIEGGGEGPEEEEDDEEDSRNLEWEVLLAVNNLGRNLTMDNDGDTVSNLAIQDDHMYATAEYDSLFGQFLENEGVLKGSPPAAKSILENLPTVVFTSEDVLENLITCAVCKDDVSAGEKVTKLPCSHHYHGGCILPWLSIRNTCPVCRYELPTDDVDYEKRRNGSPTGDGFIGELQVRYRFELLNLALR